MFSGQYPCDKDGNELQQIRHQSTRRQLADGLSIDHSFSSKPAAGYADHYEKMATYYAIISSPARSQLSATDHTTLDGAPGPGSVFKYIDTSTARAGIGVATSRFERQNIAIVGLNQVYDKRIDMVKQCNLQCLSSLP